MYPVGSGVYELARPDTIVCRCEEVTAGEIAASLLPGSRDPDPAKAVTRAGMGNCQGRNCGRHIAAIVARHSGRPIHEVAPFTARPPVKPVAVTAIAARFDAPEGEIELDREPEPRP
jgi:hypothetical protein